MTMSRQNRDHHFSYNLTQFAIQFLIGKSEPHLGRVYGYGPGFDVPSAFQSLRLPRQHLRFAASHQLVVPLYQLKSYGLQAFSVADVMTWNSC